MQQCCVGLGAAVLRYMRAASRGHLEALFAAGSMHLQPHAPDAPSNKVAEAVAVAVAEVALTPSSTRVCLKYSPNASRIPLRPAGQSCARFMRRWQT